MTSTSSRPLAGVLLVGLLAGCGSAGGDGPGPSSAGGGDEPITPRALAAVVAEYAGEPSAAGRATDLEELGSGLGAGVDFRYADQGVAGSYLLSVGVGRGFEEFAGGCDTWFDQAASGCAETADGLVAWEEATPEEDPGVVYVLVSKGRTQVLLFSSGPPITEDPRRLDLPVSVRDMMAIAADPRVDVTTSQAAIEAGRDLAFWSDSPN